MIKATKGKLGDTDAALASLKDWKYNSPRGPISIDPATRDIVMNEYLVEVVKGKDGKLHQKQLGKIDNVKDPCKEQKIGPCAPETLPSAAHLATAGAAGRVSEQCAETPRRRVSPLAMVRAFALVSGRNRPRSGSAGSHHPGRKFRCSNAFSWRRPRLRLSAALAQAQEVKVGLVAPFTGIGAELGQQIDRGMELYLKLNADEVKPYKIKLIKRDDKNPSGADAKIAVQELLTQDNVDALAGWVYSPNAIASAPIVTAGKKLAVIMNAGTAHITNHVAVFRAHLVQHVACRLCAGRGGRQAAQGQDRGGRLHRLPARQGQPRRVQARVRGQRRQGDRRDSDGRPGAVPDFTPFFQRAKDKKPDVFFVFVPAGDHAARGRQDLRRARHEGGRHQADRPGRHHPGHQAAGHGRRRGRPHHHAPLQRRPRQRREQALRRGLEEGIRRRLDAGLHGGRRL